MENKTESDGECGSIRSSHRYTHKINLYIYYIQQHFAFSFGDRCMNELKKMKILFVAAFPFDLHLCMILHLK